jgi:hypothetical protein
MGAMMAATAIAKRRAAEIEALAYMAKRRAAEIEAARRLQVEKELKQRAPGPDRLPVTPVKPAPTPEPINPSSARKGGFKR